VPTAVAATHGTMPSIQQQPPPPAATHGTTPSLQQQLAAASAAATHSTMP